MPLIQFEPVTARNRDEFNTIGLRTRELTEAAAVLVLATVELFSSGSTQLATTPALIATAINAHTCRQAAYVLRDICSTGYHYLTCYARFVYYPDLTGFFYGTHCSPHS
jgi:hypothetical protein